MSDGIKNYYSADIIETRDGQLKVLEVHNLSDPVSFTERAGYHPRLERVYRHFERLKEMRRGGEKILYMTHGRSDLNYVLPEAVSEFYRSLPPGVAHLEWMKGAKEHHDRVKRDDGKDSHFLFELKCLAKAARRSGADFITGFPISYSENGLLMREMNLKDLTLKDNSIPYSDIGLVLCWGGDFFSHPDFPLLWSGEQYELPFPILDSLPIAMALHTNSPKWLFREVVEGITGEKYSAAFPKTTYHGMGLSRNVDIEEFASSLTTGPSGIVAVCKPLCSHYSVDVSYLTTEDLRTITTKLNSLESDIVEIREAVLNGMDADFPYSDEDDEKHAYLELPDADEKTRYPVAELGTYILQEFCDAKPVKSQKTGQFHQGTIRTQILAGESTAAMYRFSKKPYVEGEFTPLTSGDPTFFERTDDETEERVRAFLVPMLAEFERFIEARNPEAYIALSREYAKHLIRG